MPKQEIKERLFSKKSAERRKVAKEIGKNKMVEFADDLFIAFLKEQEDTRTWETQVEMILSLGLLNCKAALPGVEAIVRLNKPRDMITYASAQTYVRLKRKSINDAQPVIELLKFGGLSVVAGALNPLGYDKMIPSKQEIVELIQLGWDLHKHKDRIGYERNLSDPRYGLAAACAAWDKQLTIDFLNHCLETAGNDPSLKDVVEHSLKGKYAKLL